MIYQTAGGIVQPLGLGSETMASTMEAIFISLIVVPCVATGAVAGAIVGYSSNKGALRYAGWGSLIGALGAAAALGLILSNGPNKEFSNGTS
jgi:hypothetical protein